MVARLAPVKKVPCSNNVKLMQVLISWHILVISRYNGEDFSSLSSVNKKKGTVVLKWICPEILFLLNVGEVYILEQVSKLDSLFCLFVFLLKIKQMPGHLFTLTESLS